MKAIGRYVPVLLHDATMYKVVLTFDSDKILNGVTIQVKATEQNFPVVLFIIL